MRILAPIPLFAVLGCADTALPVTEGRIATEAQFVETVAGRTVANDLATVTISRDGRITGVSDGQPIAGTWRFADGFWCRTITEPVQVPEDCQVWEIRGDLLVITRQRGAGPELRVVLREDTP